MPSIIERIARDLNVSSASVSRALNDRPGVGAALREKILARARELNYVPSVTARGLATQQTFTVGFFVSEKPGLAARTDPFYGEILHGAEKQLAQTDYHLTIATLTPDVLNAPQTFRFVRERRIDGMILAGPDIPADFILAMSRQGLPLVLVDNRLDFSQITCVNSDDVTGGYLAARHLIDNGHSQIGVLTGPEHWPSNARRVAGCVRALEEAGLVPHIVHAERTNIDSGRSAWEALAAQAPQVTGICAVNDSMAIGAIHAAQDAGLRVPDDLAVVGFDDIAWSVLNNPPLTTIHIPKQQMGLEAGRRIVALLEDPEQPPVEITVAVRLVERGSSVKRG